MMKLSRPDSRSTRMLLVVAMTFLGYASTSANPTGKEPSNPLAAQGTIDGASELVASLYDIYNEELAFINTTLERSDNPASYSERQIAKAAGRLWKAERDARHLELMGEPSSVDLTRKMRLLIDEIYVLAHAYAATPKGSQFLAKLRTKLQRESPRYKKFLEQAAAALQKGTNPETFVTQMEAKGMERQSDVVFFRASERNKFWLQFPQLMAKGDENLNAVRREKYMEVAKSKIQEQLAAAEAFASESSRVKTELASQGTAKLGEEQGDAVAAFAYLADQWAKSTVALTRAAGIQWAMTNRSGEPLHAQVKALRGTAVSGLAGVIEAAAASATSEQVPELYSGLLEQISKVDRRCATAGEVPEACKPALAQLAGKNPSFATSVEAYQRATSEPLKWRRSFALQQAANLSKSFPQVNLQLSAKSKPEKTNRPAFVRAQNRESVVAPIGFDEPADWLVYEAATRLVGKPIRDDKLIRLSPSSRSAVVPYQSSHYANVPVPFPSEQEVADLRAAIVVDDMHGPLSMEAADAVSSSELQDYLKVAGLIQNVHLEAAVTRFISMPDLAAPLVSLGSLPVLDEQLQPLQQTCWRLDLKPMWAHHRYFTVRMKPN